MSENTKIEWADHTFNPWSGCTKVSPGCDHCYAEGWSKRAGDKVGKWGPGAPRVRTTPANWRKPLQWQAKATAFHAEHGRRQRVFCSSLADVFDNQVPVEWRGDLFALIDQTPNLDWLLLTKRIGNAHAMAMASNWPFPWPRNVWLGATITSQEEADRDIPKLLGVPAHVRFLSMEPLLGPVDLQRACTLRCPNDDCYAHSSGRRVVVDSENGGILMECICSRLNGLHWVIAGGESGPGARPVHPDWARSVRDQCASAGVPFLFKQWGEWLPAKEGRSITGKVLVLEGAAPFSESPAWRCFPDGQRVARVGKKAAGRLLDGIEHNGFPEVA